MSTLIGSVGSWWQRATEPMPTPQAGGGDLDAQLARDGFAPVGSSGDFYQSQNDPDVYMGRSAFQGSADNPIAAPRDAVLPRSRALGQIYAWDTPQLREFQQSLIASGLVDADQIRLGVRDVPTLQAWEMFVDQSADAYNNAGVRRTPFDFLKDYEAAPLADGGAERAPFTAVVSNPDDLKRELRDGFRDAIGTGKIDEAKLDALVAKFQGLETAAQQQDYNAAETGGTVVRPPSLGSFVEQEAQRANPSAFRAHEYIDKFSALAGMLGGQDPSLGGQN